MVPKARLQPAPKVPGVAHQGAGVDHCMCFIGCSRIHFAPFYFGINVVAGSWTGMRVGGLKLNPSTTYVVPGEKSDRVLRFSHAKNGVRDGLTG